MDIWVDGQTNECMSFIALMINVQNFGKNMQNLEVKKTKIRILVNLNS